MEDVKTKGYQGKNFDPEYREKLRQKQWEEKNPGKTYQKDWKYDPTKKIKQEEVKKNVSPINTEYVERDTGLTRPKGNQNRRVFYKENDYDEDDDRIFPKKCEKKPKKKDDFFR